MKIGYNNTKEGNVMEIFKNSKINALFISLMMMAILLCCSSQVQAAQEGNYTYTVIDGKAEITGYTGAGGDIILPDTLGGYPVTSIGEYAFSFCISLTSISLPKGIINIGVDAFGSCSGLTSINVAVDNLNYASIDGVLYSKDGTILVSCPGGLTNITIPQSVTSIGNSAFDNCDGLTSISLPDGLTDIGEYAFQFCDGLTTINLPKTVTSIGVGAFDTCRGLTSIAIPQGVTSISDNTFICCESLINISLPEGLSSIGEYAFFSCTRLTSISIPQTVTSIGQQAFSWCSSLTSITIPQGLTSIGLGTFNGCEGLTSISLSEGLTSIGEFAFGSCTSLTSIRFNSATTTIYDDEYTIPNQAKIIGYESSTAKDYAEKYGRTFEYIATTEIDYQIPIVSLAQGLYYSLALKSDGTVWAWGDNDCGQLGDGTTEMKFSPVQVLNLTGVRAVFAGGYYLEGGNYSLALKEDGTVWAWGDNYYGELGDGTFISKPTPVQIQGLSRVQAVVAGNEFNLALEGDGTVWAWGNNDCGQLGNGTKINSNVPIQVQGLTKVKSIVAANNHSLALKEDGTVWSWGWNYSGQLGDGTFISRSTPVEVQGLSGVQAVAICHKFGHPEDDFSLALKEDGKVWAWGANDDGKLGNGTSINSPTPVQVQGLSEIQAVVAGRYHVLALKEDGTVWAWGNNYNGELGDGTFEDRSTPVEVQGLSGVQAVAVGINFSLALKSDGTIWAWGDNEEGELGDGNGEWWACSRIPVQVKGLTGMQVVSVMWDSCLALKSDGTLWAWGDNSYGRLGIGTNYGDCNYKAVPVQVHGPGDIGYMTDIMQPITSSYPYLTGPVTFVSYYPTNDSVASEVQKGGKAFRYYRILDQDGVPVGNKAFSYRFTGQSNVYIGTTDVDGYVSIETPWLSVDSHLDMEMLAEDGAVKDDVTSSPSFDVKITDRSFSQEWSILFGESISGGLGGPMAKLGPMKFETLKAGLSADFSSKVTLTDEIKGNTDQVTLASNIEGGLGADAAAGVFGSLWESKKKPELNVGFTSGLKTKLRNGVAYKFEDFLNTSRSDHYIQALAAGTFLLETSLQSLQQDPVGMDKIMNVLINRLTNLDTYQDARVSEYALGGSMGGSAEVSVLNPLGNKASIGDKMGLSLADFGTDILFSHENREQADGVNKTELSVTSSVQASFLKVKLAEIFSKNKTSKESPELEVENIIPALWENKAEGKQSISLESGAKNKLSVSQTVNIGEPFGLQSQTEERSLEVEVEGQSLNELAASSSDANNIINENKIFIGPNTFNNIFKNVLSLNDTQQWKREVKDVSRISVPFNIGLGLGLQAELGLNLEGTEELKYTDKSGILSNKFSMLCLEQYQKDNIIAEQQKDLKDFAQVYADAIGTVIKDLVVTAKGSIVEGIQQKGAYIKAEWDNCTGFLSVLKPQMNSYQILAVSPEELSFTQAATIGDVYIVNLQDAESNLIDDFTSNPIELSINFSQELLLAAGFDLSEANKLSIYRWDGATGLYVLQASVVDEINNKVTAMISQPGQYILAIDVAAPDITNFITSNSTAAPVISATVRDTFCGIDNSSFNFLLDGVSKVDANNLADYYDPLSGIFTYQVMTDLTSGGHTAVISVKDMAGNSSEANIAFQVNSSLPVINFTPVTEASAGIDLAITANITDDSGVANATLFFKPDNTEYAFQGVTMYNHSGTDSYTGVIPGTELNGYSAIRYYIKAIDRAGNKSADGAETILQLNTAGSQNDAPIAKNVAISGSAMSGQILNGSYTYSDTENDPQGLPIYKWYRDEQVDGTSKMEIAGANSYSYTLGTRDVGKYIFFEVIPIATSGNLTGTAVQSIAFGPVTAAVAQKPFTINTSFKVNQTDNVTSLTADALLDAKTIVTNNQTSGSQQVVVIVALYNHHGSLLNITYLAKEVTAGGTETFHAGFKLPADVQGSKVRVFVWDGEDYLSSPMHPLSDVTQIPELNTSGT